VKGVEKTNQEGKSFVVPYGDQQSVTLDINCNAFVEIDTHFPITAFI